MEVMATTDAEKSAKTLTMVIYALYAASFLLGITAIVAIVINYVKKATLLERSWKVTFAGRFAPSGLACCGVCWAPSLLW